MSFEFMMPPAPSAEVLEAQRMADHMADALAFSFMVQPGGSGRATGAEVSERVRALDRKVSLSFADVVEVAREVGAGPEGLVVGVDYASKERCAECDCVNGGSECSWVASSGGLD